MHGYRWFNLALLSAGLAFYLTGDLRSETLVSITDTVIVQGGIVRLDIEAQPPPDTVTGSFRERALPFIHSGQGGFYTLLGVDMETRPGVYQLQIKLHRKGGRKGETVRRKLRVVDAGFPVQELTLPPAQVFPDSAALRRIKREDELRNSKWSKWVQTAFWNRPFVAPIQGEMSRFGHRRILNGVPRSSHSGVDIDAPEGTPVLCPAAGKVILTGDFFFSGKSIYIDHGLGLIGMFFHLSRIDVHEGQLVEQGQLLGAVGSTGRVTGPHLHWGVRWRGSRVNPMSLLKLTLD
ncbi:MAG TPA: M23 family metallopeptidase [archaeon]|nr:M23 family metallopeptidase [archaeon]